MRYPVQRPMRHQVHASRSATALAIGAALLASCAGPKAFVHPEADFPFYENVGIVPFTSLGQDRLAGEKVTGIFFTELLRTGFAEVREPGQFLAVIQRIRGVTPLGTAWSTADLARLGEEAGVQGLFMGVVRDYEMTRVGRDSYPLVSVEARLVDAATGRVVWSASDTRRAGPTTPIFAWGEIHTLGELTSRMCRELLRTLPRGVAG